MDLELTRSDRPFKDLAARAFGPREQNLCGAGGAADFYRIWTLREAFAKACGIGFALVIDGRDYFDPSPGVEIWSQPIDGRSWRFGVRTLDGSYAFALAASGASHTEGEIAATLTALDSAATA